MKRFLAAMLLAPGLALAQGAYPSKPVRVIVPYPAGGIVDLMTRAVTEGLAPRLGQPVIVEARPGADASIGTDAVARSEPDGHTLLMATLAIAVNPHLNKVPWHPVNDFEGVAHVGVVANVVAVTPSLGVADMRSFVALARGRPGQINYMNPGNGSSPHVSAELLQQVNEIQLTSINYKGVPPAIPDFLAGTVPFGFFPFATIAPHVRSGKAQAIAIASPVRHRQFPDLPTMAEQGFESSQVNSWYAFAVPKKTPRAAIERLNREINAVLAEEEAIARVDRIGGTVVAGWSADRTTRMIADEYARWAEVIRKSGLAAK
jgi:tripartite-type tricarboxylate transporter receptor subunit TctC